MFRMSCSSSLQKGSDQPKILRCPNTYICPLGADDRQAIAGHGHAVGEISCSLSILDGPRNWAGMRQARSIGPSSRPAPIRIWLVSGWSVAIISDPCRRVFYSVERKVTGNLDFPTPIRKARQNNRLGEGVF